ncbi:PfkB family carbohydrate kinase [Lentilactobacillus diolivorans]|uniref:PfkB family carbohydrate kinase n=1 Tax=Lentilactobacillus diolivorans TaxID=179838 RepID=UPI0024687AA1|nr:PfkB family carbohydrate kinase [Lentilactobacillus diolivorans]MDH5106014.1 PfkB family carbohydrate kinase [Lentilactobacillus diolivorans]
MLDSNVLVAEDFSAVGRMSMTAAISIFSGFGIQTAAIPTEILSTQSEGFGTPITTNNDDWIKKTIGHWNQITDLNLASAVVGYVGQPKTVKLLHDYLTTLKLKHVLVDPVMGDRGVMYDGFGDGYLDAIKQLIQAATVITPNVTELQLLSGNQLTDNASDAEVVRAIEACRQKNDLNARVVVTGIKRDAGIGCCFLSHGQLKWVSSPFVSGHFYGTGDLFSALLCGYLNFGVSFETAVQRSVFGVYGAVLRTGQVSENKRKFGLDLTKTLNDVTKFTLGKDREEI